MIQLNILLLTVHSTQKKKNNPRVNRNALHEVQFW